MKILFITKEIPYPVNAGYRMRSWHCIRGLARAGEVRVLCFGEAQDNAEGIAALSRLGADAVFAGPAPVGIQPKRRSFWGKMLARFLFVFSRLPYAVKGRVSPALQKTITAELAARPYDVLVFDGVHLAVNLPDGVRCRKILNEHNVESVILRRFCDVQKADLRRIYSFLEWRKFFHYENRMWKNFDQIFTCSEVDKRLIEERVGHPRVRVVPNGVAVGEIAVVDSPAGSKQLVYSGIMNWAPNEDAALYFGREIFPLIKARVPDARWVIVGKDPAPAVQDLARRDAAIVVTGFVEDVKPYIRESAVFVVPLRIGSGTRLKILEALAMGKAVVSTTVGAEGIPVTHGQDILIADSPAEFAERVCELLADPARRSEFGQNGRRLVEERFGWEGIESLIVEAIRKNPGHPA